ncbi:MAG: hypothetical protein MUO62_19505 [Anaerolineales bacterium]|nr:hypothetical protein [Anaerolineales bacterium]
MAGFLVKLEDLVYDKTRNQTIPAKRRPPQIQTWIQAGRCRKEQHDDRHFSPSQKTHPPDLGSALKLELFIGYRGSPGHPACTRTDSRTFPGQAAIVLVPGHAFVAIRTDQESGRYYPIETTLVGRATLEEAVEIGVQEFEEAMAHLENGEDESYGWVTIWTAREKGINSLPWH